MKDKELKPNANAVGAFIGRPHFEGNDTDSPKAYSNSKIRTLTSNHKGITLIALVITIIVMLILVGVTISVAINGGLFSTAKDAASRTQIEKEKEQIMAGYSAYQMVRVQGEEENLEVAGETVTGNETDGWIITFDETGNTYKLYPDGRIEKIEEEKPVELTDIYVTLYKDGTLGFSNNQDKIEGKEVSKKYGNIKGQTFNSENKAPWHADKDNITTVEIQNEIVPNETMYWFNECSNLTNINNMNKLNTSKVTNMSSMFYKCSSLTELDLSSLKTTNVTDMDGMFQSCSDLKELNISGFNTENVVTMSGIFSGCSGLTELDLGSFDTSGVADLSYMFEDCSRLMLVYARKDRWNIDKETDIRYMWNNCGTDRITSKTYLEEDKLIGYEIEEGFSWTGTSTVGRTHNDKRASSKQIVQLDSKKTYQIKMNNPNYYYGCNIVDLNLDIIKDNNWQLLKDNKWNDTNKILTITDAKYAVLNFKNRNESIITPDMVDEINQALEIRVVE